MTNALLLLVLAGIVCQGQGAAWPQQPLARVNVDLVQVDVIVTDTKGNHVGDLTPEEFEILENGKLQRITNFSFLSGRSVVASSQKAAESIAVRAAAPARIAPGQADRTVAIVVDDLGVSEQSFAAIHAALGKLVEQVGPRDLIAIVTTSGRLGALQRLTSDKRLLRAAVDRFRSLPNHRPGVTDAGFTCVWYNHKAARPGAGVQDEDAWLSAARDLESQRELENDHRSVYYGLLSLSMLRQVVDGLRALPGRKSILLFSEGLPLVRGQGSGETNSQVTDSYDAFLNHANRSSVTVNTIDPRGLVGSFDTADSGHSGSGSCVDARRTELTLTQQTLRDMAQRTGGISIVNNNDLTGSITRVLNDQVGYYLVGYRPLENANDGHGGAQFRKIAIRVTRPGLRVRFHSSMYREHLSQPSQQDNGKLLAAAVISPFAIPNVRIRLTSRFWDAGLQVGSIIDTVLGIDAHDLTFDTGKDGRRNATFDVLAVIYGSAPRPLDTFEKSYTVSLTEGGYRRALRDGLVQQLQLPVKQAGAYQIRGAVRDGKSGQIGSASEFVEVPDLTHGHLALSGIALMRASTEPGSDESGGVPRFHAGEKVLYACQVLNAMPTADGSTNLELRATLYHDGKALGTSAPMSLDPRVQEDPRRPVVTSDFRLGKQLTPGDYTLEISAVDRNSPKKRAKISQTVDFEVIE